MKTTLFVMQHMYVSNNYDEPPLAHTLTALL